MAGRALLLCALCALCCAAGGGWAWDHLCAEDGKELLNFTGGQSWRFCPYNETFAATTKNKPAAAAGVSTAVGGNGQAAGSVGGDVGATVSVSDASDGNSRGTDVRGPQAAQPRPSPQVSPQPQSEEEVGRAQSTAEDASKEQREGETAAIAEGARGDQGAERAKQAPAHSPSTAEGEDAVVGGLTKERTVGKAATEASPPESAVQRSPVQRGNTPAVTAVAGEASEAAQDTAGGGGSNNSGSNSSSGPAVQPQPASSVAAIETGDAEQKEQLAVPTPKQETETSGERGGKTTQPAAGAAAQAATTTNSTSAAKAEPGDSDSDGSGTAASHSASPLALLLLLACAAAAAMLAA
ncbi:mucin-associated surface protein (MASP) [Trypanosoma conorhini]|uniref:Mucin-associated surface protein (MASP) n=1 Tax=Trypanosoma conorhini TaxID=83891 RepID=A0A422NN07_9TRYP|nr:mucin-associated surface protein (MASP) [Trypanosoma conorhini]RNF06877.1 mucin-associated surface protein (MASP) [Trypanosoma conorhini]